MTICPSCGREIVPGKKFCKSCGATLPAVGEMPPAPAAAAGALVCPACGYTPPRPTRFCLKCGAELAGSPSAGQISAAAPAPPASAAEPAPQAGAATAEVPVIPMPPQPVAASTPVRQPPVAMPAAAPPLANRPTLPLPLPLLLGIGVVVLAAVAFGLWWWTSPTRQLVAQVEAAVQRGELVKTEPPDAYFYFTELKNRDPSSGALQTIGQRVLPFLKTRGEEFLAQQLKPGLSAPGENWKLGIRIYQWAHEIDPQDKTLEGRLFYCRGQDLRQKGDRSGAAQALLDAVRVAPDWAPSYNTLGLLNTELKNYGAAIPYFEKAISLNPQWALPHNNMGTAYYLSQNYPEAERCYRQASALDPQWARPHFWLGNVYERLGRDSEALAEYETAIQLDPLGTTGMNPAQIRTQIERLQRRAAR